jgi:hypothetical protein
VTSAHKCLGPNCKLSQCVLWGVLGRRLHAVVGPSWPLPMTTRVSFERTEPLNPPPTPFTHT